MVLLVFLPTSLRSIRRQGRTRPSVTKPWGSGAWMQTDYAGPPDAWRVINPQSRRVRSSADICRGGSEPPSRPTLMGELGSATTRLYRKAQNPGPCRLSVGVPKAIGPCLNNPERPGVVVKGVVVRARRLNQKKPFAGPWPENYEHDDFAEPPASRKPREKANVEGRGLDCRALEILARATPSGRFLQPGPKSFQTARSAVCWRN